MVYLVQEQVLLFLLNQRLFSQTTKGVILGWKTCQHMDFYYFLSDGFMFLHQPVQTCKLSEQVTPL